MLQMVLNGSGSPFTQITVLGQKLACLQDTLLDFETGFIGNLVRGMCSIFPANLFQGLVLGMAYPTSNGRRADAKLSGDGPQGLTSTNGFNHGLTPFGGCTFLLMSAPLLVIMEQRCSVSSETWVFSIL